MRTYAHRTTTQERPRTGRPPILSLHQKKIIYRKVRANPKIEYSELVETAILMNADGTPLKPPSRSTLYRLLKSRLLTNHRCKKRPKLNASDARKRLQFSQQHRNFPWKRRTVFFCDECSVQKGSGNNTERCFHFPWEKWKKEMITGVATGKQPAQMVWGCIWIDERGRGRRSPLVIMERSNDALRRGYNSQSYIRALTRGLLPHWRRSYLFVQDNASIHTSGATRGFLANHHIHPINWPPYSPDLNPIEHL